MNSTKSEYDRSGAAGKKARNPALLIWRVIIFSLPLLVLLVAAGGLALLSLRPKPEKKPEDLKPTPVLVAQARRETAHLQVRTQGVVRPRTEIDVVPQISGKILRVAPGFIDGGFFKKGEVLIRIEPRDYELRVIQADAQVAQAQQRLAREQAESDIARRDWAELGEGEASPLTLREPQLAEARAMLASAKATLADAQLQLSRTKVRVPFTGRVRTRSADIGQYVTPGARLGRVFATNIVEVKLPLTDTELSQLNLPLAFIESAKKPGPAVDLSAIVAGQMHHWKGRIVRTDSAIDPRTRVLFAFVEVYDPYGKGADRGMPLAVGLFVDARIDGREIPDALVIPRTALRGNNQVFVVNDDNTMSIKQVTVVSSGQSGAVLTAGITADDRLITSPVRVPAEGLKVEPVARTAAITESATEADDKN